MNKFKQKFTSYLKSRNFPAHIMVALVICAVVFVNILIYTLSSIFPLYIYSPEKEDFSISSTSDILFDKYINEGKRVTVTFCSYEEDVENHETGKFVLETARLFKERYGEFINIRFLNALTKLDSEGKSVAEELAIYSDEGKNLINATSVIFSSETEFRVITDSVSSTGYVDFFTLDDSLYITSYNGEEIFASSVLWVLNKDHKNAYLTIGHGETANGTLYNILTVAGYEVKELDLRKNDIPEDADLVIISNPISDFERGAEGASLITEYDRLVSYRERGGSFMVFFNPLTKRLPVVESFVADFGISQIATDEGERMLIKDNENAITTDGFTLVSEFADSDLAKSMENKIKLHTDESNNRVILRSLAALSLKEGSSAQPVLVSSPSSVLEASGETLDESGNYVIAAFSTLENDLAEPSELFVMSDGMLTASDAVITEGYSNRDFLYSIFDILFDGGNMPYGCKSVVYNEQRLENLTMGDARIYTAILLLVPVIIAAIGAVVALRRKNR